MRFFSSLLSLSVSALAATAVVAQTAGIGAPAEGTQVAAGSSFNATIFQPDSTSSWKNVAIVIGLLYCGEHDSACPGPSEGLGTILYNGPFNPQFPPDSSENFTLTVPSDFPKGQSQLGVALFDLIGAVLFPNLQTFNTTIVVT